MNYNELVKGLLNEAHRGIQFKRMEKWVKIITIIGLIPLIVCTFLSVCLFYVTLFVYKAFAAPLEYLHRVVNKEGQEVKHATQFAIYWISWPFVFLLYVFQALTATLFFFQWFGLMLNVYLVTLGGVKWQPFLLEAKYDEEVEWDLKPSYTSVKVYAVLLSIFDILLAVSMLIRSTENLKAGNFVGLSIFAISVMLLIVNPLIFKKVQCVSSEEIIDEVPSEEEKIEEQPKEAKTEE